MSLHNILLIQTFHLLLPLGVTPFFLSVTAGLAYNKNINNIVTGVCQTDYSGYRRDFIDFMENSLSLALDSEIKIHTPLMYLTKAETWKMAKDLGCLEVIIHQTHTDLQWLPYRF